MTPRWIIKWRDCFVVEFHGLSHEWIITQLPYLIISKKFKFYLLSEGRENCFGRINFSVLTPSCFTISHLSTMRKVLQLVFQALVRHVTYDIFSTEEEGQAKLMDKKMYGFNILKWRGISLGKLCYILLILNQYMKWLVRVMPWK